MVVGFFFGVKKSLITILSEYYVIHIIPRTTLRILLLASPDSQVFPSYPIATVRDLSLSAKVRRGRGVSSFFMLLPWGADAHCLGCFYIA